MFGFLINSLCLLGGIACCCVAVSVVVSAACIIIQIVKNAGNVDTGKDLK